MQKLHEDLAKKLEAEHQELKGLKAVLSSQTYGHVDPHCVRDIRQACFHAANHGLTWIGDVSADRMGYGAARNHACEQLIEQATEADGIFWVDSDIRPEPHHITQILWAARRGGYDFITGVYHHRAGMYHPVIYTWHKKKKRLLKGDEKNGFCICDGYPPNTVAPIDGCGFGFVWTSRHMIETMMKSRHWEEKAGKWFPDRRDIKDGYGEDMSFCIIAMRCGFQLMVDTGVQVGHTGDPEVITGEHFQKRLLDEARKDGRGDPNEIIHAL
jgi:hypothetical protein